MRTVVAICVLWAGLLLEATLFQIPPFNLIHPNFVLDTIVLLALTRGGRVAVLLGVAAGFVQDIDYGSFIGLYAFSYGLIGYFSAAAFAQFMHRNVAITFLVSVVFTFIYVWLTYGLTRMFDVTGADIHSVLLLSLTEMIVNGLVLLLLYPWLTKWLTPRRNRQYGESDADTA